MHFNASSLDSCSWRSHKASEKGEGFLHLPLPAELVEGTAGSVDSGRGSRAFGSLLAGCALLVIAKGGGSKSRRRRSLCDEATRAGDSTAV